MRPRRQVGTGDIAAQDRARRPRRPRLRVAVVGVALAATTAGAAGGAGLVLGSVARHAVHEQGLYHERHGANGFGPNAFDSHGRGMDGLGTDGD